MRKITKIKVKLLIVFALIVSSVGASTVVERNGQLSVNGNRIVNEVGDTVQLMGMSFFWSQWMGQYYTHNTVKWLIDDWKCTVVRAALGINGNTDGYLVNPDTEKQKIETVVQAAIDLGIYVIIDWHSHSANNEQDEAVAFFTEMAQTYGQYPNIIYEPFNEPGRGADWDTELKPYHEAIITAIREYDTNNIIVCGSGDWDQRVDDPARNPITISNNIAYSLHYYAATHKQFLRDRAEAAMESGIALFVTEFGTCDASGGDPIDEEESEIWFDFLDEHSISWCNWSVADKVEAASILNPGASVNGEWTDSDITVSGNIVRNRLLSAFFRENIDSSSVPLIFSNYAEIQVGLGQSFQVSVDVSSPTPPSFQWYFDGNIIDGATSSVFSIAEVSEVNSGLYYVEVTNSNGTTVSDTLTLEVIARSPYDGVIQLPGIIEMENYDIGGNGYTYYDLSASNEGGKYRNDAVDIESSIDGGHQVGWMQAGEWLEYTVNVETSGMYHIDAYVASQRGSGTFSVNFGDYESVTFNAINTDSWTNRTVLTQTANLEAGEQIVRINMITVNTGYNIDKIDVVAYNENRVKPEAEFVVETETETETKINENGKLKIYPNYTKEFVNIKTNSNVPAKLEIYNNLNKVDELYINGSEKYSVSRYDNGIYYFKLYLENEIVIEKIIKQ